MDGLIASIYIPTHPASTGPNLTADQIRLKNALKQIRENANYNADEFKNTMNQLEGLHDNIDFWSHQDLGLAIFFNRDNIFYTRTSFEVSEVNYLGDHPIISPLLAMEEMDTNFYALDINITQPRLFYGLGGHLELVNEKDMPKSLKEELGEDDKRKDLQHSASSRDMYYGHDDEDSINDEIIRYLKLLAESVNAFLSNHKTPLILCGTSNRIGDFRNYLSYPNIIPTVHEGSVEKLNATELFNLLSPLVSQYFLQKHDQSLNKIKQAAPQFVAIGKEEIQAIINSETSGRIDSLYLPIYRLTRDSVRAGDNNSLIIELPGDIYDIETVVASVVRQGGKIVPVEIGKDDFFSKTKALCRY